MTLLPENRTALPAKNMKYPGYSPCQTPLTSWVAIRVRKVGLRPGGVKRSYTYLHKQDTQSLLDGTLVRHQRYSHPSGQPHGHECLSDSLKGGFALLCPPWHRCLPGSPVGHALPPHAYHACNCLKVACQNPHRANRWQDPGIWQASR